MCGVEYYCASKGVSGALETTFLGGKEERLTQKKTKKTTCYKFVVSPVWPKSGLKLAAVEGLCCVFMRADRSAEQNQANQVPSFAHTLETTFVGVEATKRWTAENVSRVWESLG